MSLRHTLLTRRQAISRTDQARASERICTQLIQLIPQLSPATSLAIFYPLRDEINILPLLDAPELTQYQTCLPVTQENGLAFYPWQHHKPLIQGNFSVLEPQERQTIIEPDILIVPMLGFTPKGDRIGYGKGYYDRALTQLKAQGKARWCIGVAYDELRLPKDYQAQAHDVRMDIVVTPSQLFFAD